MPRPEITFSPPISNLESGIPRAACAGVRPQTPSPGSSDFGLRIAYVGAAIDPNPKPLLSPPKNQKT